MSVDERQKKEKRRAPYEKICPRSKDARPVEQRDVMRKAALSAERSASNGLAARPARPDTAFGSNSQAFANWTLQRTSADRRRPSCHRPLGELDWPYRPTRPGAPAPPVWLLMMGEPVCQVEVLGTTSPTEMRNFRAARRQVPADTRSLAQKLAENS